MKHRNITITILGLGCFALASALQAVTPAPDGGYPEFTTAEGTKALQNLTSGAGNTGLGWYSLFGDTSGNYNTAVGAGALVLNNADSNTATGVDALLLNTTGTQNTANGMNALVYNDSGSDNTAVGAFALNQNTTGLFNTATGFGALFSNVIGSNNTAIGFDALGSTTVDGSTAVGFQALMNDTTGGTVAGSGTDEVGPNTAVGAGALFSNTTGGANTAVGYKALATITAGVLSNLGGFSTAIGFKALASADTSTGGGYRNDAFGYLALTNLTTGHDNTALGSIAGFDVTTGANNVLIGLRAGGAITTGESNVCVGVTSGTQVTTASNVIAIGTDGGNLNNSCFIGNIWTQPGGSQAVYVNSAGKLGAQVSSRRFKDEIKPLERASEVIYGLKPVSFRYKCEIEPTRPLGFGLIAEEVAESSPDLITRDGEGRPQSVRYDAVNAMLLNEFLKEHRKVLALEKQVEKLTAGLQKVSDELELSKSAPRTVADKE